MDSLQRAKTDLLGLDGYECFSELTGFSRIPNHLWKCFCERFINKLGHIQFDKHGPFSPTEPHSSSYSPSSSLLTITNNTHLTFASVTNLYGGPCRLCRSCSHDPQRADGKSRGGRSHCYKPEPTGQTPEWGLAAVIVISECVSENKLQARCTVPSCGCPCLCCSFLRLA